jgi:hypothetical protein
MNGLVWYVSYGSNMHAERFYCYLRYPGARDHTLPSVSKAVWIPGGVYFATESQAWGGGRAFYDPDITGTAAARAYLITAGQFSDVAAQEMYREPGADLDLAEVAAGGRIRAGNGRYETLIHLGRDGQAPMVTFTAPWGVDDVPLLSPSPAYLRMLGQGLCQAHAWDSRTAGGYLAGLPGARGNWTPGAIASLLAAGAAHTPAT